MDEEIIISPELKSILPPLTPDEYKILEESLLVEGCRNPLIIWNNILVDGYNRYAICTKHNIHYRIEEIQANNIEDIKLWIIDNQKGRRNLTDGWKFELAQVRKEILLKQGRETQGARTDLLSIVDKKLDPHNTRNEIAEDLGWSTGKVAMADRVWKEPEIKEKVKNGEITINQAYQDIKKDEKIRERKKQIQEIKERIAFENTIINNKYDVVVIDPPWAYEERGGLSVDQFDPINSRGACPYPTMKLSEIAGIQLPLKDDAVIFLWTTHAFLHDSFHLLDQWGLQYKATLVWDKEKMGMGRTIRLQCEFCLMATLGNPLIEGNSERDIIRESRKEHSRKPEAFYLMVEKITTGKRMDYFSRTDRKNWDTYGAETNKF
jgi:N6-adenosine-specific RNA methylase IME4